MRAFDPATFVEDLERELLRDPPPRPSEAQLEAVGRLLEWMRPHLDAGARASGGGGRLDADLLTQGRPTAHDRLMLKLVALVTLVCSCEPTQWDGLPGVPEGRVCSDATSSDWAVCVVGGRAYQCVKNDGRMLCAQSAVEIQCTKIVDVEAACPR